MKNILKSLKAKSHKGFTIIQLVIGMLIFVILTGIAFLGSNIYTQQANKTKATSDLNAFSIAIETAMLSDMSTAEKYEDTNIDTYISDNINIFLTSDLAFDADENSALLDPWGNPYIIYTNESEIDSGTQETYVIVYSKGSNAVTGSSVWDDDDDVVLVVQYKDGEVVSEIMDADISSGKGYDTVYPAIS